MRMHGHAAHDDMKYVPREQVELWRKRDPIDRQDRRLRELGVDVDAIRAAVQAEIDAATEDALASPMPDPGDVTADVFAVGEPEALGDGQAPWSGFAAEAADLGHGAADLGHGAAGFAAGERDLAHDAAGFAAGEGVS
jgi:pyruvate dehydrogenase E1 component alpha subunit